MFTLIGLLVASAESRARRSVSAWSFRTEVAGLALAVARYLAAGALLAWRLG